MAVQISGNDITVPRDTTVTRNLTVGGVLTYEDVTNVDSIGIVTARAGVLVGSGITLSKDGDIFATGVTTSTTFSGNFSGGTVSGTTGTFTGDVDIADKIVHTGDTNTAIRFPAADTVTVETGGSEGIRIDSGGRLLVGTENARTFGGGVYAHLQLEGTTQQGSQFTVTRNSNDTYAPNISLVKTRGTSDGAVTTVQDNDSLGTIQFRGADGSDVFAVAASITGEVDGSPSDGTDMPGALVFGTTVDGAASPTERLRIASDGQLKHTYDITSNGDAGLILDTDDATKASSILFRGNTESRARIDVQRLAGDGAQLKIQVSQMDNSNTMLDAMTIAPVSSGDTTPDVTLTGNLKFASGNGIDFSATSDGSGTASSEVLDEYEEGSFDVNYKTGGAGSNTLSAASYATTGGLYTKIGNMVHFQIRIKCSSHTAQGGQIVIEGLPFTHVSTNIASGAYITASQMLSGSNNVRLIIGGTQIEFQNLDGTAFQAGSGGVNFNNEFHCAGSYIAA